MSIHRAVSTVRLLQGTHTGRTPRIVPRVNFELKPMDLIGAALDAPQALVSLLLAECLEQRFDGWVSNSLVALTWFYNRLRKPILGHELHSHAGD